MDLVAVDFPSPDPATARPIRPSSHLPDALPHMRPSLEKPALPAATARPVPLDPGVDARVGPATSAHLQPRPGSQPSSPWAIAGYPAPTLELGLGQW